MEHIRSKINSLASEDSPYLLQHKDNPVHWYPFGDAAFAAAICEDKPIFLSIGYATCHWCHVMAHESFEDDEVAALLNRNFISIKVDREERPDVDAIYMSVAQMMTGSGGWPLTLILTPEGNPVFAATYIPKTARYGSMGLVDLLELVTGKWRTQRNSMLKMSSEITDALQRHHANVSHGAPDSGLLDAAFALLERRYDPVFGGFSSGTKFPTPHNLIFLLRYFQRTHNARALQMAENTLKNMRAGGIFDHFGLGFHRYSTDAEWLVPHFEKMLYDQAMLMLAYTEAFEAVQRPLYREVAGEIGNYLQNRMRSPEGAFYSAEDADSEGVEGKYYVWTMDEIHHALVDFPSQEAVDGFATLYHLHKYGNFESPHTPQRTNIPHIAVEELESWMELNNEDPSFEVIRKKLLTVREQRIPPLLDDKILTDWNGLAIAAFAKAGRVFRRDDLIGLARGAASHIKERMTRTDQTLWHRYRHGNIAIDGQLDDYAFLIFGLIELHQATFEVHYLEWAVSLTETANRLFLADDGSYYMAAEHTANLIVRPREFYDGALPSGNSVMMDNLVRLASLLGRVDFEERANRLSQAFYAAAKRAPDAHTHFLLGLGRVFSPSLEIVIVGEPADPRTVSLLAAAQAGYVPNRVVLQKNASNETALGALAPYTVTQVVMNDAPTGYVCVGRHCEFPTNSPDKVKELVKRALL